VELHIGIDDFDSPRGMCTTYFGALIADYIKEKKDIVFLDYPYLIRLNPNIPFKTRGNGAVSLHLEIRDVYIDDFLDYLEQGVWEYADLKHGKSDPVILVSLGKRIDFFREIYRRALKELVPSRYVLRSIKRWSNIKIIYPKTGRGIVGAVAAIGAYKLKDFTYELLFYRDVHEKKKSRAVDQKILLEIDKKYRPLIFANFDYEKKRMLALSHGPDPVILGIRSLDPYILLDIFYFLAQKIKFEKAMIYKSNQGTNSHLSDVKMIKDIRPYDSVVIKGVIFEEPTIIRGGHVIFIIKDETGRITCSVYKQTGRLNRFAKMLMKGDYIEVGGGIIPSVLHGMTLNVEYIRLIQAAPLEIIQNPLCPICGNRMESLGRNKGFRCSKCGYRSQKIKKIRKIVLRYVEPGLYIQSPIAYRHLTKPLETLGMCGKEYNNVIISPLTYL